MEWRQTQRKLVVIWFDVMCECRQLYLLQFLRLSFVDDWLINDKCSEGNVRQDSNNTDADHSVDVFAPTSTHRD